MTYVYKVNNPGFDIYLRKDIFKEGEPVLPPFTSIAPISGAFLPWFDFDKGEWEETADDAWIAKVTTPESTKEDLWARLEELLEEADDIKRQLT